MCVVNPSRIGKTFDDSAHTALREIVNRELQCRSALTIQFFILLRGY